VRRRAVAGPPAPRAARSHAQRPPSPRSFECLPDGAFRTLYDQYVVAIDGAPARPAAPFPAPACERARANATAAAWAAAAAGGACPAPGAAAQPEAATARVASIVPDRSAEGCPEMAAGAPARAPAAPPALDFAAAVDVAATFPPFQLPGGPRAGSGAYTCGAPGAATAVGLQSRDGFLYPAYTEADGLHLVMGAYASHECTGPLAWRATGARRVVFFNGTTRSAAFCEAARYDPAARRLEISSSDGACPPADFGAGGYGSALLAEVAALGSPEQPCGVEEEGGGGAASGAASGAGARAAGGAAAALTALLLLAA
jgi:hypothetical protein